jgi:polynucleotide 5'-kinase involved in rRNA processing
MRVLQFDGEPERVDDLADAEIETGAMQERLIDAVVGAPDIVIPVFVAEAVIETDIEPLELVELCP